MRDQFARTELLIGKDGIKTLQCARVAVFGIGGVGGIAAEALARAGIGAIDLIDDDRVCESNLNRQIFATVSAIGRYKVDVAKERILDINPDAAVFAHKAFYSPETSGAFDFSAYDYVIDAIDTVTGKISLVVSAQAAGTPIISAMGAGNKLDASAFEVADIYETSVCPLARVMRRELRKRGVTRLKVVYSKEPPISPGQKTPSGGAKDCSSAKDSAAPASRPAAPTGTGDCPPAATKDAENRSLAAMENAGSCNEAKNVADPASRSPAAAPEDSAAPAPPRRQIPGSISFVPPVAGLLLAGEVVRDLLGIG